MKQFASLVTTVAVAALSATALAQQATDYTIAQYTVGSRYESPPSGTTTLVAANGAGLTTGVGDDGYRSVNLPFQFTYFGTTYSAISVNTNGYVAFGTDGQEWINSAFPLTATSQGYSVPTAPVCAYFDDLVVGTYHMSVNNGTIQGWTAGNAPFRHYVVSWESIYNYGTPSPGLGTDGVGPFTFQIQLYETTGAIVLAYVPGSYWPSTGYTLGIEAADGRYEVPSSIQNSATANNGIPPYDYSFTPPAITFTGRMLYDRYVVDSSGIGNSSEQNIPLKGFLVEALNGSGAVVGAATTDSNGAFSMPMYQVPTSTVGSVVVCAQNSVCAVRSTSGGPAYTATAATSVSFAQSLDLGTLTLGSSNDATGAARAPINVARTIQTAYEWTTARTTDTIPFLEVLYDTSLSLPTSYTPASGTTTAAWMRVGASSSNPDPWDVSVIRRVYGRHVLSAIAASPTTPYNSSYDAASDAQNAFAEGFGYYFDSIISGSRYVYDGISSSSAITTDLETATGLRSTKSASVAGWVAAGLFDLLDPANETFDTFNGAASSGAAGEQVFHVVDALTSPITATSFYNGWLAAGYDAQSITQDFIAHGLIVDDTDEPNDDAAHATPLYQFGFILPNRVLNLYNEDWYAFTLPDPTSSLTVSVVYDRSKYASVVLTMELKTAAGTPVATGTEIGATGPVQAVTGALAAGDYRVRVALSAGGPLPAYTLQAFSQLAFTSDKFQPWTVGRPYSVPVTVKGGIPPYGLSVSAPYAIPDGLGFDIEHGRVAGTPTGPSGGLKGGSTTYDFVLKVVDGANPVNEVSKLLTFTVNDVVRSRFGEFSAFALGKTIARPWPAVGGTSPYTVSIDDGSPPSGITVQAGGDLRFVGKPDTAGRSDVTMTVTDVAGSFTTTSTHAVVCLPVGPAQLPAGDSACGFYFDALQGSSIGLVVAIDKKKPVRALRVVVLDSDGNGVLQSTVKVAKGKATVSGVVPATTGRFYCVVATADSGAATSLVTTQKLTPPKAGAGNDGTSTSFGEGQTLEVPVPALAGATVTFSTKVDKSGLVLQAVNLFDPSGARVDFGPKDVVVKKGAVSFKKVLPTTGVWKVVLGAAAGPQGHFTYSYKLKQPPKVAYSAD